ncbi:MAG: hypothetical protein ABI680_15535, partial [Chthoniobacteraceae bacterium]
MRDSAFDESPARDEDEQEPDETWRTSYSRSVSAHASKNGIAAASTGFLNAQLSVNGNTMIYTTAGRLEGAVSGTFPETTFSGVGGIADSTIDFRITERSNYSIIGAVSAVNNGTSKVYLRGSPVSGSFKSKTYEAELPVNTGGAQSLEIADGGVLEPGTYNLQFQVVSNSPQPRPSSVGAGNIRFVIGDPPPAEEIHWINTAGGNFGTLENWNPARVPNGLNIAIFDPAEAYTVDVGTAASDRLVIENGDVTFTSMAYAVSSIAFDPASVVLNNAKLTLASGQLNSGHALIGASASSRLDVKGDATWISTGSCNSAAVSHTG